MSQDLNQRALERQLAALADTPAHDPRVLALRAQLAWVIVLHERTEAKKTSEEVLALGRQVGDELSTLLARRNLAYIKYLEGRFSDGLAEVREVIEGLRRLNHGPGLLSVLDMAFHGLEALGDYGRALEMNVEILELAERLGRPREKAWAYTNIAFINAHSGDFEGAMKDYEEALAIFQRIQYPVGVARVKSLLGALFAKMDRVPEALGLQVETLQLYRDVRMRLGEGQALMDIGAMLERLGRFDDAASRYRSSIAIFDEIESATAQARVELRLGQLFLRRSAYGDARTYLEAAKTHLEGSGSLPDEVEVHRRLAGLERSEGRFEAATEHYQRAVELRDQLNDQERSSALERIKTRLEIERAEKDAEIHRLKYVELANMQARLIETERLAVVGDLAAGFAHEINNPLGVLRSNLDLLNRAGTRIEKAQASGGTAVTTRSLLAVKQALASAREATDRIDALVRSLKRFSKLDEARQQTFDLNGEIENLVGLVRPRLAEGVELEASLGPIPELRGVPSEINQALMTLLVNAAEATTEGEIRVRTNPVEGGVEIQLSDTGRGMSSELVERLFEPDFSPSGKRVRFRVGLPSARAAINRHGGDISVTSTPGQGTEFRVRLPIPA